MATITWRSGGGSGVWAVGSNWDALVAPGAGDTAVLGGSAAPYTVSLGAVTRVADIALTGAGATLDLLSTLTLAGAITVAIGAGFEIGGTLLGGTLDLTGGGALKGSGGTLDGLTMLGQFASIGGSAITNGGAIGWATTADGAIALTAGAFSNFGRIDLAPVTLLETGTFVVGVQMVHNQAVATYGSLDWQQAFAATVTVSAAQFRNSGQVTIGGGSLGFTGAGFTNTGSIDLTGIATQTVAPTATVDGIAVFGVIDSVRPTQVTFGPGVTSFSNIGGTILAGSILFQSHQSRATLGTLIGGLTFEAGLDLAAGALTASQISVAGLVQDGTLNAGTLTLAAGTTLDSVSIAAGTTVQATGPITLLDPPSSLASVTLDATTTELAFSTVTLFNGQVVAGSTTANDVIGVFTPGGVSFGSAFTLSTRAGTTVGIGGPGTLHNAGTLMADAATLDVTATLAGSGAIMLANGGAAHLRAVAAGATPSFSFGAGTARLLLPGHGALGGVLTGLHTGDVIDFAAISSVPNGQFGDGGAVASQGSLLVTGASGDTAAVAVNGASGGLKFKVATDGHGGTLVEVACFVAGTRIATPAGAVPVETLRPGDRVRTASGRLAPVRWVGSTRIDLARHPAPWRAAPIRIAAGAFGAGRPARDLLVSPEHCLLVGGVLIPAGRLANGATVARQDGWASVSYWHVELDRHDALLAEGLPAESYLDTGNRGLFAGVAGPRPLHPALDAAPAPAALAVWAAHGCAALCLDGPRLARARAQLRRRAVAAGWAASPDDALVVQVDGSDLPVAHDPLGLSVRLPAGTTRVRLRSRSFVPAELDLGSGDTRRLGVAVAQARLAGWPLHPDAFAAGWHDAASEPWRWSDGEGVLLVPRLARPTTLSLRLGAAGCYWQAPDGIARVDGARVATG